MAKPLATLIAAAVLAAASVTPARAATLPPVLARAIAASGLTPKSYGIYAQEVVGHRTVLALNEEQPYTMASTTKIVTSLAALDLLGPYYRWHTSAYALGTLANGRLDGDLLIVGGGNAELSSGALLAWLKRMRSQGLREIDGDIVLDREAFQLPPADFAQTPRPSAFEPRHVWPDAMTLDAGVLNVVVGPGRGGAAALALHPVLSEVTIDGRVAMGEGAGCSVAPRWQAGRNGHASVVVEGRWSAACGTRAIAFVPPPDSGIAARALPALWAAAGGVLHGRVVAAAVAPGASPIPLGPDGEALPPLSFDRSKPLIELVRDIDKNSDNVAARNLMLSLSPGFPERPATLAGARRVIGLWLRRQGLDDGDVVVRNGSGLSHEERARPRALVQLLRRAWHAEQARAFFDSLPVAGVDGTLKNRLRGGPAQGQAHLKTGTLNDTRALAGYVHGASGTMYAVAVMVNHADAQRGRSAIDAIIEWLARNG